MIYSLYVATTPDGRRYVGCTSRDVVVRWREHRRAMPRQWPGHASADFADAVKLFGYDNIKFEHVASAIGGRNAANLEADLIRQYWSIHPHGYNRSAGGRLHSAWRVAA